MLEIRSTPSATEDKLDDPPHRRFFLWLFFLLFFLCVCEKKKLKRNRTVPTATSNCKSTAVQWTNKELFGVSRRLGLCFFFCKNFFFQRKQRNAHAAPSMANLDGTFRDDGHRFEGTFFWAFFFLKLSDWRLDVDGCWLMLKQRQTSRDRDRDDDWSHNPDINSEDDPGEIVSRTSFSFFFTEFYWVFRTVTPGLSWFYLVLPGFTVRLCFFLSRYCFGVNRFFLTFCFVVFT